MTALLIHYLALKFCFQVNDWFFFFNFALFLLLESPSEQNGLLSCHLFLPKTCKEQSALLQCRFLIMQLCYWSLVTIPLIFSKCSKWFSNFALPAYLLQEVMLRFAFETQVFRSRVQLFIDQTVPFKFTEVVGMHVPETLKFYRQWELALELT